MTDRPISDEERARRKAATDFAKGSVRAEGFHFTPEADDIDRRFVAGEISGDEHLAEMMALSRKPVEPTNAPATSSQAPPRA